MNENLEQQLASALNMDVAEEVQEPVDQGTTTEQPEQPVEQPVESEAKPVEESTPQPKSSADNSTIKQMRDQISNQKNENTRLQNLLQRIADDRGISIEQLEEDLQAKEDAKVAKTMNVPPEVARQLRTQEERIKQLEEQSMRDDLMHRVDNFKRATGLNDQQTLEFLKEAQERGINPIIKGTDLLTLYRAINFDRLAEAKEAELRQQILNDMQRQREQANDVLGSGSTQNVSGNSEVSISDQDFIKELKQNLK